MTPEELQHPAPTPVAEIEVGGSIAFNTSVSDIIPEEEDDTLIDDRAPLDTPTEVDVSNDESEESEKSVEESEKPEQKPEENSEENSEEEPISDEDDEDKFADYSESALYAMALKERHPELLSEIDKDLSAEDFLNAVDSYINNRVAATTEYELNTLGNAKDYVEFLLQGGNPQDLQRALSNVNYSKMEISEDTPEEQLEDVVRAMYTRKDVPKEDMEELIDVLKDTNKLAARAKQAVSYFSKLEKDVMEAAKQEQELRMEQQRKFQEEQIRKIQETINSGNVMGIPIPENEKKSFLDYMMKPTETIEQPMPDGSVQKIQISKSQKDMMEFNQNLDKTLAFYRLLQKGFSFEDIEEKAKAKRDSEVLKYLNNNQGKKRSTQRASTRNAYKDFGNY